MATTDIVTHTPGPWRIDPNDDSTWRILGPGEGGAYNNSLAELDYTGGNAEANAHLIAAAPELFAMVERIADLSTYDPRRADLSISKLMDDAKAAIAKARGQQ